MYKFFTNFNLLDIVETAAIVVMAYVAFRALETWKQQMKAQKKTDFLDELTDTIHEYIQLMVPPIEILKIVRIGMESYSSSLYQKNNVGHPNVVAYIENQGKEDSKQLWSHLKECNKSVAKIQSLVAKGQVYDLDKYEDCNNSCQMLVWQHQRLQVIASVIGKINMNWEHPMVQKSLDNILSVDSTDIEKHLKEQNTKYLEFVNNNYRAIY